MSKTHQIALKVVKRKFEKQPNIWDILCTEEWREKWQCTYLLSETVLAGT